MWAEHLTWRGVSTAGPRKVEDRTGGDGAVRGPGDEGKSLWDQPRECRAHKCELKYSRAVRSSGREQRNLLAALMGRTNLGLRLPGLCHHESSLCFCSVLSRAAEVGAVSHWLRSVSSRMK